MKQRHGWFGMLAAFLVLNTAAAMAAGTLTASGTGQKPVFLFDGRNILDHKALFEIGFKGVGKCRSTISF